VTTLSAEPQKRQKSGGNRSTPEVSTSIMLIAYSAAFVLMQTPATLLYILEFAAVGWMYRMGAKVIASLEHGSNLLIILNSCTNFYIFLLFGSRFRRLVWQKLVQLARQLVRQLGRQKAAAYNTTYNSNATYNSNTSGSAL